MPATQSSPAARCPRAGPPPPGRRTAVSLAVVLSFTTLFAAGFGYVFPARAGTQHASAAGAGGISNIGAFLQECPTADPLYSQIRADFEIRKDGVAVGVIPCSGPVSSIPIAQYTDELIAAQTLRTVYYMEGGRTAPYPWTSGSLYDSLKSRIGGVDIRAGGSYCCESFNGKWYIVVTAQGDLDRDADRRWQGISDRIALFAHETRHVDGFPHVGGCPLFPNVTYGCDETYDERSLSPYGIQWWLNAKWLSGEVDVGFSCLSPTEVTAIANFHLRAANNDYGRRFVETSPPVLTMPAQPGGPCPGVISSSPSPSPGPSPTETSTPTGTAVPTRTATQAPTAAPTPAPSPTPPPTPSPTPALTPGPTAPPTPTATPPPQRTPSPMPTAWPTPTVTPTPANAPSPSPLNRTPTPIITNSPTPTATVTPSPGAPIAPQLIGDLDCSGAVTAADALDVLRLAAGLQVVPRGPCATVSGGVHRRADVDCSGEVTARDALDILRYLAGLTVFHEEFCPDIGSHV